MQATPQKQHEWLKRLVGEWVFEAECPSEPGSPPGQFKGNETVRMLGDLWAICEGQSEMPGVGSGRTMMAVGYDPAKERFVGSWIGTMMPNMWVYEGTLDVSGNRLPLSTTGPDCQDPTKTRRYQDVIEFHGDNERTLTSQVQQDDGSWKRVVVARYRRT